MILILYRALTDLGAWPIRAWLRVRAWRGKEEPLRLGERRGVTSMPRPPGQLVWCHAASVGESIALLPLIAKLQEREGTSVLLTTGTTSSARVMAERLPPNAIHQFAPWDRRAWIARFLDYWQPDLAVRMESEVWPNTVHALHDGRVPIALISGRMSESSVQGWQRFPSFAASIFKKLNLVLAQSDQHAKRFAALGAPNVKIGGNLKLAALPLPAPPHAVAELRTVLSQRPVWLAASTHAGEEGIVCDAHVALRTSISDLLTIIAPRHPERREAILHAARTRGFSCAQRSQRQVPGKDTDIYLADTFGDLGVLFSVAPVVFMGKSLTAHGGQNPLEPLQFECAVVFGPNMENFEDIAPVMVARGSAVQIATPDDLVPTVERLLSSEHERTEMCKATDALLEDGGRFLDMTLQALDDLLTNSSSASEP